MHSQTRPIVQRQRVRREAGMALVTVILVTMLCAALMVGFTSAIVADLRSSGLDRDQTQAYAAAQTKDQDRMTEVSETVNDACVHCHRKWRPIVDANRCK